MKTTKLIAIALFVMLTAQIASAYYCPSTGRWLSRDPIGELSFQALQASTAMPQVGTPVTLPPSRWIQRDNLKGDLNCGNIYTFVRNDVANRIDPDGRESMDSCKNAPPETSTSVGCAVYGNETYAPFPLKPVSLKCFCQNAPDDDWSKQVRGCLMCMHAKGIPSTQAHNQCYAWASEKYHEPRLDLLETYAKCRICQHYQ